ncbi:TetR family transcriptional regulator [Brevibacterium salitolerans]|jgi:AcrR family transcriptional regulator|uniref:HTH tetR-type domain-containing protein n=1 Tax=Brevibacterium salitolerans TaxID=1403566 RepID=A0ABP5I9S3_9MICO
MVETADGSTSARARGRPRSTSGEVLRRIGLRMFAERGFENTTVSQIAGEAGVTERTFFRYYGSKAGLLWSMFESQKRALEAELKAAPDDVPMMDALRHAVIAGLEPSGTEESEQRMLAELTTADPVVAALVAEHFAVWERSVSEFAGRRLGQSADSLYPVVVGRTVLAACRAALEEWAAHPDRSLTGCLDSVLVVLATGLGPLETQQAVAEAPLSRKAPE